MSAVLLGDVPALPLHEAGKYVAAAYIVLFGLMLVYLAIMAIRLTRIERELGELLQATDRSPDQQQPPAPDVAERESTLA
jgi:hypothetical protein